MDPEKYAAIKKRIVPQLRFNQEIYEDVVIQNVSTQTVWLDAGCGHQIFPSWRKDAEQTVVRKARLALGCDTDGTALRKHRTLDLLVLCDLAHLPFKADSVSLITCNMVAEHLDHPLDVFREFERILQVGGRVVVHTPNVYSHFVIGSRFLPRRFKLRFIRRLDRREECDVFPTHYRANTPRKLRMLMSRAGLKEEKCRMLASDATLATTHPLLVIPELFYIKLTLRPAFKVLRCSILANFVKAIDEGRNEGEQARRCHP